MTTELTRTSGGVFDRGDPRAPVGTPGWAKDVHWRAASALRDETAAAATLRRAVHGLRESQGYQQLADAQGRPFMFWDNYCEAAPPFGLGLPAAIIEAVIDWRQSVEDRARDAVPVDTRADAGAQGGRGRKKAIDNIKSFDGGTGADYLTARIARYAPEVLAEMERGEHSSVRAAAKKAGLVKDRWSVPAASLDVMAAYLRRRLSADQCADLAHRLAAE